MKFLHCTFISKSSLPFIKNMSGKKWLLQLRTYVNVKSSWSWKQNLNSRYYVNVKSRRGWRQKHRTVFYHSMIAFEWYLVLYRNLNLTPGWLQIKGLTWTHLISHCCQQSGIELTKTNPYLCMHCLHDRYVV